MTLNNGDEAKKQEEAIDNYCLHLGRFNIYLSKQEEAIASSCLHVATGLIRSNTEQDGDRAGRANVLWSISPTTRFNTKFHLSRCWANPNALHVSSRIELLYESQTCFSLYNEVVCCLGMSCSWISGGGRKCYVGFTMGDRIG